jgi:hypothetical protein
MPETTPIYGFPYPCEGEDITVASFANLANAIDAKLLEVQADEFEALNRYSAIRLSASNVIAAGVVTVISGTDSTYTIPADGVWVVSAKTNTTSTTGTPTSHQLRVRKNAVVQYGIRQNPESAPYDIQAVGCMVASAGDVISFQFLFGGTGNWTLSVSWRAQMLVRIA